MQPTDAIHELMACGLSEAAIASLIGVNQSTINRIRRGQAPSYKVGKALVDAAESSELDTSGPATVAIPAKRKEVRDAV